MEVPALCVGLVVEVLVLLLVQVHHSQQAQKTGSALPRVLPDRLQFFEYETVHVTCEDLVGLTEWRVMRSPTDSQSWNSSAPSCTIELTFERDSGEYWCEDAGGNSSAAVSIAVTAGSVILEVPASPVPEGSDLTLHCREKKSQLKYITEFYKDGSCLKTVYENNLMIRNVSKSDEGLYMCSISGVGDSPQSWLAVSTPSQADEETRPPHGVSPGPPSLMWVGLGVSVAALLLMVVGLFLCRNPRGKTQSVSAEDRARPQDGGDGGADPDLVTYSVIENPKRTNKGGGSVQTENSAVYSLVHLR